MAIKRRVNRTDHIYASARTIRKSDGAIVGTELSDFPVYSRQITESEGHYWPKGRGERDVGGDFDTLRLEYVNPYLDRGTFNYDVDLGTTREVGTACLYPNESFPNEFTVNGESDEFYRRFVSQGLSPISLDAIGSKLVASAIPTNPLVDGAVSLAELFREGIPRAIGASVLRDRVGFLRSLGSEYLNVEFGWKPLISDIRSAAKAVLESDALIQRLVAHSGKRLHRFRMLPDQVDNVLTTSSLGVHVANVDYRCWSGTSQASRLQATRKRNWFSGEFTYYLDPSTLSESSRIATQARLLYGLQVDPEVLWNLTPWSWLVDWVANVGPLLHNVSAFQRDGLVMRYGYVMQHDARTDTHRLSMGPGKPGLTLPPYPIYHRFKGDRKMRRKANPFGFGIVTEALNTRQLSILTALGLTRGK